MKLYPHLNKEIRFYIRSVLATGQTPKEVATLLCRDPSTIYRFIIAEEKQQIEDWECDTIIGKDRRSVLVTVVDRAG